MTRITAPALRRGLDILELFVESGDELRIPDITQRLGLPRATTHELVSALAERGYLQPVPQSAGRYTLGVNAFRLGAAYERELDLVSIGNELAAKIAAQCGETVQLVVRDGTFVIYIARADSIHPIRLVSHVGSRMPAHCTAGGKVMLASLSDSELNSLFPDDEALSPMTPNSIDSRERLHAEIATIRARGWAEETSESNTDAACVAAPVYNRSNECVAAISISVPMLRWSESQKSRCTQLVRDGAKSMSANLGSSIRP